jgi:hypothetical protein
MNRDRWRTDKPVGGLHALVPAAPETSRRPLRIILLITLALSAGVLGGLVWLSQQERGTLETLPDQAAVISPTLTIRATAPASVTPAAVVAVPTGAASAGARPLAAKPFVVETPTPTPTSTPRPPLPRIDAVVGIGGSALFDESGLLLAELPQGAKVAATASSADDGWLLVETDTGQIGWVAADTLIIFDAGRLAAQDVVIIPITPTPTAPPAVTAPAKTAATTAATTAAVVQATPLPVPAGAPTARVTVDSGRLNLRAGPGPTYAIIAKAQPDTELTLLGRSADSAWLQVVAPDLPGGFAWAAVEFLTVSGDIRDLPAASAISDAPAFGAEDGGAPTQGMVPLLPTPTAAIAAAATGLTGKLAIQVTWGGDIYLYDLATGELRLLTDGFDPSLSPDGKQVAFSRRGGEEGLYLIGVDGSNERRIFGTREPISSPKWSPDGRYIVFERGDEADICRIEGTRCFDNNLSGVDSEDIGTEVQNKLARVDVNGKRYRDLPVLNRARVPDWNAAGIVYQSPAGLQITQDKPNATTELLFFDIQKQYELDPDWQPGGGRVVFQRREAAHWQIFAVNPDGSGLTALTRPGTTFVDVQPSSVAPAWSPDGSHIVFLSNRPDVQVLGGPGAGEWGVWVMDADGDNQRRLPIGLPFVYTYVAEQMLDWGP